MTIYAYKRYFRLIFTNNVFDIELKHRFINIKVDLFVKTKEGGIANEKIYESKNVDWIYCNIGYDHYIKS